MSFIVFLQSVRAFFVICFLSLAFWGCSSPQDPGNPGQPGNPPLFPPSLPSRIHFRVSGETCRVIPNTEKLSSTGAIQNFYALAENPNRAHIPFIIPTTQSVYVVGDVHGVWEVILNALVNSGLMELDTPARKVVSVEVSGRPVPTEIPNLRFRPGFVNKVIFMGDYIAKTSQEREVRVLGLLNDVLEKQSALSFAEPAVVAILGNHDFEAVNGVVHPGYGHEKNYQAAIYSMVDRNLLVPSHFYNGIWYSHSYLTPNDLGHLRGLGADFYNSAHHVGHSDVLNRHVRAGVLTGGFDLGSWLSSSNTVNPANFMYAMSAPAADGFDPRGHYDQFPMIVGHLSDPSRQVLRVLTEGFGGRLLPQFTRRSHVLCTDTSIFLSREANSPVTYLRIEYNTAGGGAPPVEFQSCSVPML